MTPNTKPTIYVGDRFRHDMYSTWSRNIQHTCIMQHAMYIYIYMYEYKNTCSCGLCIQVHKQCVCNGDIVHVPQMNTGYVHSSGALMLEPMGQQLIITVTKRGGAESITITSNTPAAAVTSVSHSACIYMCIHCTCM